jgi:hypothetical protein
VPLNEPAYAGARRRAVQPAIAETGHLSARATPFIKRAILMGHLHSPPAVPPVNLWFAVFLLSFVFSSVAPFRRLFYSLGEGRWLGNLIDSKWGAGTYREFLKRLRPAALMMLFCLVVGIVGLAWAYANDQSSYAYFTSAFSLSIGLGLLLAYF